MFFIRYDNIFLIQNIKNIILCSHAVIDIPMTSMVRYEEMLHVQKFCVRTPPLPPKKGQSNASTILNDQYHRSSSAAREIGLIKLESFSNRIGVFFT